MWIRYEVESGQLIRTANQDSEARQSIKTVKRLQSNIRHPLAAAVEVSFMVALSGDVTAALSLNLYSC